MNIIQHCLKELTGMKRDVKLNILKLCPFSPRGWVKYDNAAQTRVVDPDTNTDPYSKS
jgi:hypothetical protein